MPYINLTQEEKDDLEDIFMSVILKHRNNQNSEVFKNLHKTEAEVARKMIDKLCK